MVENSNNYYLYLNNLREHECIIFKLICSVSQRSKGRVNHYILTADADNSSVDIVINDYQNKKETSPEIKANLFEVFIADNSVLENTPIISRPLIATKVLTTLDSLVDEHIKTASPQQKNIEENMLESSSNKNEQPVTSPATSLDGFVFNISEEDASELAIVHDETLANPANSDEESIIQALPHSIIPFTRKEKTQSNKGDTNLTVNTSLPCALVVDDSPSVRKQLELELDLFEVTVDYAESAEQALSLIEQQYYDIAFLDVVLPDKDGFQICKHLKATSKGTVAIMLTGKATQSDRIKGSLSGCDAYLVKPVGRTVFQNAVKMFLTLKDQDGVIEAQTN